jgi:hypothetical protein
VHRDFLITRYMYFLSNIYSAKNQAHSVLRYFLLFSELQLFLDGSFSLRWNVRLEIFRRMSVFTHAIP